jgi:hypothetical protein
LSIKVETNLLSIINSWLNKFGQITTKVLQEYFPQIFRISLNGRNPGGLRDLIDEEWEKGRHGLEMIDGCPPFNRKEDTAVSLPSN